MPRKKAAAAPEPEKEAPEETIPAIVIDRIQSETLLVPIVGTSPLITHRFSEKAKRIMLDNMRGQKSLKEPKDPEAEYEAAFYRLKDGRPGLPANAFKKATVAATRMYGSSVTMVSLRQCMFFRGEPSPDGLGMVAITGQPTMREDVVRVARGGTDLRYRPQFMPWSAMLTVIYVKSMLTRSSVVSLIDAAGLGVGVGEWRPERDGDFGTFQIDTDKDVEVVS